MNDSDVPRQEVAAACIKDKDQRLLWTWNYSWGSFGWPMTKIRPGESPRQAAERAAAEALGTPVQAGVTLPPRTDLYVSDRDHALKLYSFHICRTESHPRYAAAAFPGGPHVWLRAAEALSGDFRPLSPSCLELTGQLLTEGLLPGRSQLTSTLVVTAGPEDDRRFLVRWNESWGYALPSKRRARGADVLDAARRVAVEELALNPSTIPRLAPASPSTVTLRDESEMSGVPTFYIHSLFRAVMADDARPRSAAPLVWVSVADVVKGTTDAARPAPGDGVAKPGPISRTVYRILEALSEF
jgi:8-oxo-dGTP pyrophosphatase MutT (NUDIX family)